MGGLCRKLIPAVRELLRRTAELELLDRVYVIAAGSFVSLLPVILLLTGLNKNPDASESVVASELIERLDLRDAAAEAVRQLLPAGGAQLYVTGLAITLFGAFSLSRRAARAYSAIWGLPDLPRRELWRGLVWVLLQLTAIVSVGALRDHARAVSGVGRWLIFAAAFAVWIGAELLAQRLITLGRIAWRPLWIAAGLVALGRLLVAIWATLYLSTSLSRQAELYGPIGVVFSMFTSLFAAIAATLIATLIAATFSRSTKEASSP